MKKTISTGVSKHVGDYIPPVLKKAPDKRKPSATVRSEKENSATWVNEIEAKLSKQFMICLRDVPLYKIKEIAINQVLTGKATWLLIVCLQTCLCRVCKGWTVQRSVGRSSSHSWANSW
jgi:hypothetical protein